MPTINDIIRINDVNQLRQILIATSNEIHMLEGEFSMYIFRQLDQRGRDLEAQIISNRDIASLVQQRINELNGINVRRGSRKKLTPRNFNENL